MCMLAMCIIDEGVLLCYHGIMCIIDEGVLLCCYHGIMCIIDEGVLLCCYHGIMECLHSKEIECQLTTQCVKLPLYDKISSGKLLPR